jgi:hypothetical protein
LLLEQTWSTTSITAAHIATEPHPTAKSFSLPTMLPHEQQLEMLERFASEVAPIVRKAAPTILWTDGDPYGGRPAAPHRHLHEERQHRR